MSHFGQRGLYHVLLLVFQFTTSSLCIVGGGVRRQRLYLRTGSQCSHEELHLVDKVSSLHLAPVDLFARPSEVAPLGVLDDVALRQLFGLATGELDQNLAAALWAVPH